VGVLHADFTEPLWAVARFTSYAQTTKDGGLNSMWAKMGDIMIAKCAESLALRKAFPFELSGLYTQEEMGQAEVPSTREQRSAIPQTAPASIDETTEPAQFKKVQAPRASEEKIAEYMKLREQCRALGLKIPLAASHGMAARELDVWIEKTRERVEAQQKLNRENLDAAPVWNGENTSPGEQRDARKSVVANAADSFQKTKAARVAELAGEYENSSDELDADFQNAVAKDDDEIHDAEIVPDATPAQSGLIFEIPPGTPAARCRSCEADVYWVKTKSGKNMPANADGTSHFSTCPSADQHRETRESKHLAALLIAAQKAGFSTERETMIAAINSYMAGPHFSEIHSRKQLTALQCKTLISAIEGGFLTWEKAGGAA
jgi:hypothetical protein